MLTNFVYLLLSDFIRENYFFHLIKFVVHFLKLFSNFSKNPDRILKNCSQFRSRGSTWKNKGHYLWFPQKNLTLALRGKNFSKLFCNPTHSLKSNIT